jgi:hypothetical protein
VELPALPPGGYRSSELREPQPVTALETPLKSRAPVSISRFIDSPSTPTRGAKSNTKRQVPHSTVWQARRFCVALYCGATPGRQSPVIVLQAAPAAQSTALAHGKAHFWNWTLQRASPHDASLVQGSANGPGVAIVPAGAAVAPGTTGAGVAAVTTGCGWATVGAGATYGAGAAAGVSFSLAQAVTTATSPLRAMRDLRSIEFLFPRRSGRSSKRRCQIKT